MQEITEVAGSPEESKQVLSTENHLRFVKLTAESYGGIHKDMQLVIMFDDVKRIIGLTGDQGTCKTSTLSLVKALLGAEEVPNAINATDKTKAGEFVIKKGDDTYITRLTKSSFTVTKIEKDLSRSKKDTPKAFLRNLIGPIGINPMELKYMKGKEQIKWMRDLYQFTAEQIELESKILKNKETAYASRKNINARIDTLKSEIKGTGLYGWDDHNKTFVKQETLYAAQKILSESVLDEKIVTDTFEEKNKILNDYNKGVEGVAMLSEKITSAEKEIVALKLKLEEREKELVALKERKQTGDKYIEDNKNIKEEYDKALKDVQDIGKVQELKKSVDSVNIKITEFNSTEEQQKNLNSQLVEYDVLVKKFVKDFTPDIPGLEIVLPGIDAAKEEGVYLNEKTPAMLSESELISFCVQLWASQGVKIGVIENITSLGTEAIDQINKFASDYGAYIFYSAMDRGKSKIQITFHDKIS